MVITLRDLSKKILVQWRMLLIAIVIMAIAMTGLGIVRSKMQNEAAQTRLDAQIALGVPSEERIKVPPVSFFDPKMFVLGAALGFLCAAGVVSVHYVLTGKLRGENDLIDAYSLGILGVLRLEPQSRRFVCVDRFIRRLYEKQEPSRETVMRLIATDIVASAEKAGVKSLYFTGNGYGAVAEEIADLLKDSGLSITCGELAIYSPEKLREMLASEGIVLFETVEASNFSDITREISYTERYSIPLLGAVVIE